MQKNTDLIGVVKKLALNKEQAIAKAREEERERAVEIVTQIFGGTPPDTISFHNWYKAVHLIKGEEIE